MYNARSHPIYPANVSQNIRLNPADFCDLTTGTFIVRCKRCHALGVEASTYSIWNCPRCDTTYTSVADAGVMNYRRHREVLSAYKDFASSTEGILKCLARGKTVIAFAANPVDSLFLTIMLLFWKGSGMILDDNPNTLNRQLVNEVYQELTGRHEYAKATYRWISSYDDISSHLRMNVSTNPLIIRRSVQPLRYEDLCEMEDTPGEIEWLPGIDLHITNGGVVIIHSLHAKSFEAPDAQGKLQKLMLQYADQLRPSPKIYLPCYNNIMLK